MSSDPDSSNSPLKDSETDLTGPEWLFITLEWPSTVLFHNLIVWSAEHEAINYPLGATLTS